MDFHNYIVTFLKCHTNNKSESVLNAFMSGVQKYGFPCKVRTDHGGENIEIWRTMMNIHNSHACVITGSSTHNERIERQGYTWTRINHRHLRLPGRPPRYIAHN